MRKVIAMISKGFIELIKTFTGKKSLFSSKRIERFLVFSAMLVLTIVYAVTNIKNCSLSAIDFAVILGVWMTYAGFNTIKIKKDNTEDATDK